MDVRRAPLDQLVEKLRQLRLEENRNSLELMEKKLELFIQLGDSQIEHVDPDNLDELMADVASLRARAIDLKVDCGRLSRTESPADPQRRKAHSEFEELCALLENIFLLSNPELLEEFDAAVA